MEAYTSIQSGFPKMLPRRGIYFLPASPKCSEIEEGSSWSNVAPRIFLSEHTSAAGDTEIYEPRLCIGNNLAAKFSRQSWLVVTGEAHRCKL